MLSVFVHPSLPPGRVGHHIYIIKKIYIYTYIYIYIYIYVFYICIYIYLYMCVF
jgi:hypothetical protein